MNRNTTVGHPSSSSFVAFPCVLLLAFDSKIVLSYEVLILKNAINRNLK